MKKHYCSILLLLFISYHSFAQINTTIQNSYERYFDFHCEALFLHLKQIYLFNRRRNMVSSISARS